MSLIPDTVCPDLTAYEMEPELTVGEAVRDITTGVEGFWLDSRIGQTGLSVAYGSLPQ